MAGYTRQDTANNIANGSVIDADDLDGEFNAVESAFNASSGHAHDGSSGQGAPVTKVGPGQDIIVGTTTLLPKTNNTLDLGSSAAQFKNGYFDGTLYTDTANVGVNGRTTIIDNSYTVSSGDLTLNVAGDITLDVDGGDVLLKDNGVSFGKLSNNSNQLSIYSGTTEAVRLTDNAIAGLGDLSVAGNTTLSGTLAITGNTTASGTIASTGGFTGALTGTVSSVSNHDTDDITEGSSNLYHTTARARGAISATGNLSYNSSTGVISFTQGNTDTVTEGSTNLYHTTARARGAISATGNLSYNSSTGVVSLATDQNVIFSNITANDNISINNGSLILADGVRAKFGNSSDLSIYHDPGANFPISYIQEQTGHLYVWVTSVNKDFVVSVNNGSGSQLNLIKADGSSQNVTLNQGTTTRLETTTTGVTVTGALTATSFIGNASTATALATARTIGLTGDVTGSVSFNGTSNATITAVIADDSHNHTIANVDGLQTEIDTKAELAGSGSQSFSASTLNATTVDLGNWTITESGGVLYFATSGTNKMKLDASGNLTVTGDVTGYGTI